MLFNSISFLLFFPIVVIIYFIIPRKIRYIWLLVASYYFYMSWNPKYALLMGLSTIITYLSGILIEVCNTAGKLKLKKACVSISLISNLGILCLFKYANFFLDNINAIISGFGFNIIDRKLDLLLPVGISFYTFQALSYSIDVYRGQIKAEKNILKYALFVAFFPQLVAGPIERSSSLLTQIQNVHKINVWNYDRIRDGILLMLWGFFQKLVIADRASLLVDNVINHYEKYGFLEIIIAVFLFGMQIYCDFGGYTNIARGAAKVMGFSLMQNFRQPYFAVNIKDFWRRWHISLTSWFTDYLYIPLGGNQKGTLHKYWNILIVFLVSGLWHGASWNFIVWGLLHAIYQIVGDVRKTIYKKRFFVNIERQKKKRKICEIVGTFILVNFAWIFFVCNNLQHAIHVICQMFSVWQTTGILSLGLDKTNWILLLFALSMLLLVDVLHEKGKSVFVLVGRQKFWIRWVLYIGLIWITILFGVYGQSYDTGNFIYFQF